MIMRILTRNGDVDRWVTGTHISKRRTYVTNYSQHLIYFVPHLQFGNEKDLWLPVFVLTGMCWRVWWFILIITIFFIAIVIIFITGICQIPIWELVGDILPNKFLPLLWPCVASPNGHTFAGSHLESVKTKIQVFFWWFKV